MAKALWASVLSYLTQIAVRNSLVVMAVSIPLGWLFSLCLARQMRRGRWQARLFGFALLASIALPPAAGALLWRSFFENWGSGATVWPALLQLSLVHSWRLLPILTALLFWGPRSARDWLLPAAALSWVGADVLFGLLITRGEPFNGTYTLAGWAYQQAAVNGASGRAALLWGGLLLGIALLAVAAGLIGSALRRWREPLMPAIKVPASILDSGAWLLLAWTQLPILTWFVTWLSGAEAGYALPGASSLSASVNLLALPPLLALLFVWLLFWVFQNR